MPELERGAGRAVRPGARRLARGLLDQVLEAQRVYRVLRHLELIAPSVGDDARPASSEANALRSCET